MKRALVTGASGFIGNHLVSYLKEKGYFVRGCDISKEVYRPSLADEFIEGDLRIACIAKEAVIGMDEVYSLAANMGGIGYIGTVRAEIMHDNVLINNNCLDEASKAGVKRLFYASSACIYPVFLQENEHVDGLAEHTAYPALPDSDYGWEKLFSERLCQAYSADFGIKTRIARLHNVYGPYGAWTGGREKAPAAVCRKVAEVEDGGKINIWGDGCQTRSFCYIDDCVEGIYRLIHSDFPNPLNIGSEQMVTINQLVDIATGVAGKTVHKEYDKSKPSGRTWKKFR